MTQVPMPPLQLPLIFATACMLLMTFVLAENIDFELRAPALPEAANKEAYLCMTKNLPDQPLRLVEVHALAKKETVHHILLFGCTNPLKPPKGDELTSWECLGHSTCQGGMEEVLFGWGKDAPPLVYPNDIGLAVGPGSAIKYIVAQVHYLKGQPEGDNSGVRLVFSPEPGVYGAGLLSYASWFTIPPRQPSHLVNNTCCYRGWEPLTAFAMRVHTHDLGSSVWLERFNKTIAGPEKLAEVNPQLPQFFYNVTHHQLWPGQQLRAVCDFNSSSRDQPVTVGATHEFEMCNLYLMVYSRLPFVAMCTGGLKGGLGMPGALDQGYTLIHDPTTFNSPDPKARGSWGDVAGDVTSAASAADGSVWVLHRGNHHWQGDTFTSRNVATSKETINEKVVMQLDAETGEVLRAWGAGVFHMPHMMNVDKEGNLWIADVGLHQVLKFSPKGKRLLAVGTAWVPGADETHFCKPADVAVLLDGSFIVADGYCNNRVVKFDADGHFVGAAELPAADDGQPVVHSIMVDECRGVILVAQREVGKLQMLDINTLKLKGTYDLSKYGKVWSVNMGPYGSPLVMAWRDGKPLSVLQLSSQDDSPPSKVTPELVMSADNDEGALPNDFAIGAASTNLTGPGPRLLALYIAKTCTECGPLSKWVAAPEGFKPIGAEGEEDDEEEKPESTKGAASEEEASDEKEGAHNQHSTKKPARKHATRSKSKGEDVAEEGAGDEDDMTIAEAEAEAEAELEEEKGAGAKTEAGEQAGEGDDAADDATAEEEGEEKGGKVDGEEEDSTGDGEKGGAAKEGSEGEAEEAAAEEEEGKGEDKKAAEEEASNEEDTEEVDAAEEEESKEDTEAAAEEEDNEDAEEGTPEDEQSKVEARAAAKEGEEEATDEESDKESAGEGKTNATEVKKGGAGGVEVTIQPEKPKPLTKEEEQTKAVLTKLAEGNTSSLPTGQTGSDKITQTGGAAAAGTVPATSTSTGTDSSGGKPASATAQSGVDPAVKEAVDAWKKEGSNDDYDAEYLGEYDDAVDALDKISSTSAAALLVSEHHVAEEVEHATDLVVVTGRYTTRQGSSAVQVILVACVIAVFLAVFAINTLGGMKARVYHPVPTADDSLPVVSPKSSPFVMDSTNKPAHRRRAG